MTTKPKRYSFEACDEVGTFVENDRRATGQALADKTQCTVIVKERTNFRDVTPLGDPPGLLWEYDEDVIDEVNPSHFRMRDYAKERR